MQLPDDLSKHGRPWSAAIEFNTATLAQFGVNSWEQIVNTDQAVLYTPIDLDMSQIFRLSNRIQLNIGDIVDMGQLQGLITSTVNRALVDRKITTNRNSSNSPAGTNTGKRFHATSTKKGSPMGGNH